MADETRDSAAPQLPDLPEKVRSWIGQELSESRSEFAIERGHIESMCSAVEWDNPIYWDEKVANELVQGPMCPPSMLSVWLRPHHWAPGRSEEVLPLSVHFDMKRELDLPEAIITGNELSFGEPVRPGDVLTARQTLVSVSEPKRNKLGLGRYWVIDVVFRNQRDEWVGTDRYDCFGYRREE
jgi:acyl dehydratase